MKEIKFHKLKIRNFLSIGNEVIEVDFSEGLNIITGINRDKEDSKNGVGKSSISDALFFSLFGTPLRDIKVDNIPNWKTNQPCEVSIEFTVIDDYIENNYKVERSLNPSRVSLIENDENISRTISKTNSKLKKILGTTPAMFEQSVSMSINQTEPFLQKRPVVKRKFIEGIFKLDIFSEMLSIIRHDLAETKRLYQLEKTKLTEIQKNLAFYKQQQIEQTTRRSDRITELERRRKENLTRLKQLKGKMDNAVSNSDEGLADKIQVLNDKENRYEAQVRELIQSNSAAQSSILTLKEKLEELDSIGTDSCVTCKRPFEEADIQQHSNLKQTYENSIDDLNDHIEEITKDTKQIEKLKALCKSEIASLIQQQHQIALKAKEVDNITSQLKQSVNTDKQIKIDIESVANEKDSYIDMISDTVKRINSLNTKQETQQKTLDILDISKFVVSDEGVRSFIVKKMLKMLNSKLNYYLKKLDANCICTFDEYFDESIFNEKGRLCSYANFSGGERKRIDLAMLFTFLDIRQLQSNISINLSIYDELLDSSLDSKGIECVLEILKDRIVQYKEAVYIISHKSEAIKHATGDIIYLEKQNEITRRFNYGSEI